MTNRKLSVKNLECQLQNLNDFTKPQVHLEQYATPPHIAALMLNTIEQSYGDIKDKFVADLGCGTGRLTVGSLLCGASMVVGFDLDRAALNSALRNIQQTFCELDDDDDDFIDDDHGEEAPSKPAQIYRACENFNLVQADVARQSEHETIWTPMEGAFDTVIMNPPFGTKQNQGLDLMFLKRAISLTNGTVYSLHKTSTREHIASKCKQWEVRAKPIAQIRYNLDNTYKFHRKRSVDIEVDLWRIWKCD